MTKKKRSRASGQTGATPRDTSHNTAPSLPPCPGCGAFVTHLGDGDLELQHVPGCQLHLAARRARQGDAAWFAANPAFNFVDRELVPAEVTLLRYRFPQVRLGDTVRVCKYEAGYHLHWLPRTELNLLVAPPEGVR